jgi:hypothetical protein
MIVAGSTNPLLLASAGGYNLTNSLRFRQSASAYLNRTPASNGNQKTFTISFWVKRGKLGDAQAFVGTRPDGNNAFKFSFDSNDKLNFDIYISYQSTALVSTQVFRDPSAWYHIVAAFDSTQATASNRVKIYVNGSQITAWSTATYPSLNDSAPYNSTIVHNIGRYPYPDSYLDGYLTEFNSIDGQALTPSSFGSTSATTGVWQPKKYAGTYGTNGFYLPFTDNSALTTSSNVGLGKDFSGNGNYWTTNNISITSGATYDSMTDVPTLTSATASNFCVVNPLNNTAGYVTVSAGNLNVSDGAADKMAFGTMALPTTGKWYFEYLVSVAGAATQVGLGDNTVAQSSGAGHTGGNFKFGAGGSWSNGDLAGVAIDMDAGTGTLYKNNSSYLSLTGLTGTTWYPCVYINDASGSFNFGQRPFAYTPPTGFVALNTFNLPTPTIGATASTQANKYFDVLTWTGTSSTSSRTFTGLNFQPDFVWSKNRVIGYDHCLYDAVRGAGSTKELISNSDIAEGAGNQDQYGYLSSFNSDGFSSSVGSLGQNLYFNDTAYPAYVAWNWNAGGTTVTNTSGSISAQVRANTSSGFSVVTYTGTGSNATIGHGLGVAPKMIICKARNTTADWYVYHASMGTNKNIYLNAAGASSTSNLWWNNTAPTSTVFSVGDQTGNNGSGVTIVAYCFSEIAGYSKIGSYTGNGSTDGTFVYTGFRPKYIMSKSTSASRFWFVTDTSRDPYNVCNLPLFPNDSQGETAGTTDFDILSNGFKARTTNAAVNGNGETIIYIAFAENPYKYSLAR